MEAVTGSVTGSGSESTSLARKNEKPKLISLSVIAATNYQTRAKCGVNGSGSENTAFTRKLNRPILISLSVSAAAKQGRNQTKTLLGEGARALPSPVSCKGKIN